MRRLWYNATVASMDGNMNAYQAIGTDSGKEVFAAATLNYKEEVLFQVNYRSDLTTANMVRYNGTLYNITRIDTFEGYKEDLTLYCVAKKVKRE